ncbi:MAG: TrpB-like pyridoxal phosphate-dependent enzyme, partial [Alphaproteobacteria bacterium]
MSDTVKYVLDETDIPKTWYNIAADLPEPPAAVLHPGTGQPVGPDDLAPLFPMAIIMQEVSTEREIDIPEPVRDIYRQWRPSPLFRARRLEKELDTPAKIYYKYEGVSPAGLHKPNTAIAQAFYNKEEGIKRITTETGAGQWGSSLALAGSFFGLEIEVFMVKVSFNQKPYRKAFMEAFGARCVASPSEETESGRAVLQKDPNSNGSLGIAISEAVERAVQREDTKYALGSVLNHVLTHQTVIGQEALKQMDMAGDYPDMVIGCTGGGSNFAGLAFPFIGEKLRGGKKTEIIAVEPAACPTLTRGEYAYDFGDTGHLTPLVKMHTLGSTFVPPGFHAGGLRYHGMAPLVSQLAELGEIKARAYHQTECFDAGVRFAKAEGILPAPEANHAVKAALDEALKAKEEGKSKTILFNLSGHGNFDMGAYSDYFAGKLVDQPYDEGELAMA